MRLPNTPLFAWATLTILACRAPSSAPDSKGVIIPPQGGDQGQIGTGRHPVLIKVDPTVTGSQGVFAFQLTLAPSAPPGTTLFVPAGRRVGLANSSPATATLLVVFAPPHMAEYIRSLGSEPGAPPRELTPELLQELGRRHHVSFP